jgi:hypothetical protein
MLIIVGLLSLGTLFSTELSFSGIISLPPFVIVHPFPGKPSRGKPSGKPTWKTIRGKPSVLSAALST